MDPTDFDRSEKPAWSREAAGTDLTKIGGRLLARAHQILADRNRSSDTTADVGPVRIGISSMLLDFLADHPDNGLLANAIVTSDICSRIAKAFEDGDVDVAMVMDVGQHRSILGDDVAAELDVEFAWMKTNALHLDADRPLPLAIWPADRHIILNALTEQGRGYRVIFTGPDYSSKFTAVRSGKCLAVVPRNAIAPPFVEAMEAFLPTIAPKKILLAARTDRDPMGFQEVVALLSSLPLSGSAQRQ